jgi:hypothetical protein
MDKALLEQHLAIAQRHVVQGESIIARQRQILVDLERGGHDTAEARRLLAQFLELQALHVADRDRLRGELGLVERCEASTTSDGN